MSILMYMFLYLLLSRIDTWFKQYANNDSLSALFGLSINEIIY